MNAYYNSLFYQWNAEKANNLMKNGEHLMKNGGRIVNEPCRLRHESFYK